MSIDLEQTFSGLPGLPPKRLLAPSPINLGALRDSGFVPAFRVATEAGSTQGVFSREFPQEIYLGSQHPSPNVKNPLRIRDANWLEIITSRDAKSACFQGSQTSCTEKCFWRFFAKFGQKRSHHVMDASC